MRYSNEFYFVTPGGLLDISEIPVECGLIEIGIKPSETPNVVEFGAETFSHVASEHEAYCRVVVPVRRETVAERFVLVWAKNSILLKTRIFSSPV